MSFTFSLVRAITIRTTRGQLTPLQYVLEFGTRPRSRAVWQTSSMGCSVPMYGQSLSRVLRSEWVVRVDLSVEYALWGVFLL